MIVSSQRKLISTTVASKQKYGMSKVFQEHDNIVEENFLQMKFGYIHFQNNVIIITMAFSNIISIIQ